VHHRCFYKTTAAKELKFNQLKFIEFSTLSCAYVKRSEVFLVTEICVQVRSSSILESLFSREPGRHYPKKKNMAASAGENTDISCQNGYYQGDQEHAFFNVHL